MKIAPKAAEAFLAAPEKQCRAVLLYGPDAGLARERALRIKNTVLAGNDDPFAFVEMEEDRLLADPAQLAGELRSFGLLAGKRLIWVRDAGDKLVTLLKDAVMHFHDAAFLIVTAGELSTRSSLRGWFEQEAGVAALACYRDESYQLGDLVRKAFAQASVAADGDVIDYLSQQLGNDRGVSLQEIAKLITYAGDAKRLHMEDAQALVDYNRDTNLDDIVTAAADKNLAGLDAMLAVHIREGTQPVAYLRALQRYFNRLYMLKSQMAAGQSTEAAIANLKPKVFFKQEDALKRHLRNWELPQIVKALALLVKAETECKTSDIPALPASSRRLMQLTQVR